MKKSVMIGIGLTLFCIIAGTLVSYAAGSNPPSNGVKYTNNGQTTVQGALNDLYDKVGNTLPTRTPDTSAIAVGGSRTYAYGIYPHDFTVSCANRTCPSDVYKKYTLPKTEVKLDTIKTASTCQQTFSSGTWKRVLQRQEIVRPISPFP